MGRTRKTRKDLPERVYQRRGAYYFVDRAGKWHGLGKEFPAAMVEYAKLNAMPSPVTTLGHAIDRYTREILPTKGRATQQGYLRALGFLRAVFGEMRPDEVTPPHIYAYMDKRPAVSANREIKGTFSDVFQHCIRWGMTERNPCRLVTRNTENPRTRYVSDADYTAIYNIMPEPIQCAMDIAVTTGLRQADIIKLRLGDWTEAGLLVKTGKTGRVLLFDRTPDLAATIARCRSLPTKISTLALIYNREGQHYTSDGFRTMWQRRMVQAMKDGLITERFTFHDLRAKAGSESTDDKLLGHKNAATLERHYKRAPVKVTPIKR
ncbi:MAG: tyrosine-type recombinase/integrase [Firmicutes bacterium]|nr:tyrosine-type recombinase/integrase [Bacillota bacterium]